MKTSTGQQHTEQVRTHTHRHAHTHTHKSPHINAVSPVSSHSSVITVKTYHPENKGDCQNIEAQQQGNTSPHSLLCVPVCVCVRVSSVPVPVCPSSWYRISQTGSGALAMRPCVRWSSSWASWHRAAGCQDCLGCWLICSQCRVRWR